MLHNPTIEERYLSGIVDDAVIINHYQTTRKEVMKSAGVVYTPQWVVASMLSKIDLKNRRQRIIEPSCGHGSFILPLVRFAAKQLDMSWEETYDWFRSSVSCCDVDSSTVAETRTIVSLLFRRHGVEHAAPDDMDNIFVSDGLAVDSDGFDIAIGNPPYIRTQGLETSYLAWLRSNFEIARQGNIDIYYAFLDKYARSVDRCVFIIPNGCIKATGARKLRERVFPIVEEIIDFKSRLVFPNARTYTCIISTRKGHDGFCTYQEGTDGNPVRTAWKDLTGSEIHSAPRIAKSGIATLADSVFTVKHDRDTGEFHGTFNSKKWTIEPGIVRPLIKVTKIGDLENDEFPDRFTIFPYTSYSGNAVIPEDDLRSRYPMTFKYLLACREKLMARDKGKTGNYPAWYSYGRSQGLHDLERKNVVFIPTMIGGKSKPKLVRTHHMTDKFGGPLFVSGFAITERVEIRNALLSDEFLEYVRSNGSPKPGAKELYYSISSKHVNAFLDGMITKSRGLQ